MRRPRFFILVALLALAGSCRDSTGPGTRFGVTLSVDGTPNVTENITPDGQLSIRCDVSFIASARNSGTATWADGTLRFYFGRERKVAADSQPLSVAEVQNAWGTTITSSAIARSDWYVYAGAPFDAEFEFRFADGTAPVKTRFTCGPPPVLTATDAPTVTNVVVSPNSGTVQAGDTLRITYSASAPGTLWSTEVSVSGPFGFQHAIPEHGVASVTRTVDVVVPPASMFNIPIVVSVEATDPALQWDTRDVPTPMTVVDQTPPVVLNASIAWYRTPGQYYVGETIPMSVDAFDNNSLAWIVWDVRGAVAVHDSARAPVGMNQGALHIPIATSAAWVGTDTISTYLRDGTGAASAVRTVGIAQVSQK